ncbi:MAG: hypothetical protein ACYDGL_09325 [Bellilinea sp.]
MNSSSPARPPRPFWLKLLALSLLILSTAGWLRMGGSILRWNTLQAVGADPGPLYMAVTGLFLGTLAMAASIAIWTRAKWAPLFTQIFIVPWLAWLWIDRAFFASSPNALANWPFLLGASVLVLAIVFLVLQRGRRHFL